MPDVWPLMKLIVGLVGFFGAMIYVYYDEHRDDRRSRRAVRSLPESDGPWTARRPPAGHRLTKRERHPYAKPLTEMLLTLYEPQHPFLLGVSNISPQTVGGFYAMHPYCRITVHDGWRAIGDLYDTAIHEFAHHVLMTEFPRRYKAHGREFKTVYSILVDCFCRRYYRLYPDGRYYLEPAKRIKGIALNTK